MIANTDLTSFKDLTRTMAILVSMNLVSWAGSAEAQSSVDLGTWIVPETVRIPESASRFARGDSGTEDPIVLSRDERIVAHLNDVIERGLQIFQRDSAASVATDALFEEYGALDAANFIGYVTEPSGDQWRVTFIGQRGGGLVPEFQAWTSRRRVIRTRVAPDSAPPISRELRNAFLARQTAQAARPRTCTPYANASVIPIGDPEAPEAYDVYVLSATAQPSLIIAGGHTRLRVSPEQDILEQQEFTRSCVTLQKNPAAVSLFVTHVLSDFPNEIHVYMSLSNDVALAVLTQSNRSVWLVQGEFIAHYGSIDDIQQSGDQ